MNKENLKNEIIRFTWKGVEYNEEVKSFSLSSINLESLKEGLNEVPAKYAYWSAKLADINKQIADEQRHYAKWYRQKYAEVSKNNKKFTEKAKDNEVSLLYSDRVDPHNEIIDSLTFILESVKAIVKGFEIQYKCLQSINSITREELNQLGYGNRRTNLEE